MKKTRILSIMASAVAAVALLAGCNTENDFENGKDGLASLELSSVSSSDMLTRAVIDDTAFPTDKGNIGLFLFKEELAETPYGESGYTNVKYSYDSDKKKWTASPSIKVGSDPGYLFGYYPYSSTATDVKEIPVESSLNGDDVMYATKQTVNDKTASQTAITMNHALARVCITVVNKGYTGDAKLQSIKFAGAEIAESGTLNAVDGTITAAKAESVTLTVPEASQAIATGSGSVYECLLVPSAVKADRQDVALTLKIDGQEKSANLTGDNGVIFGSGVKSRIIINLSNSGISVGEVSIDDWQTVEVGEHTVTVKLSEDAGIVKDVMVTAYIENENVVVKTYSDSKKPLIIREEDGKLIVPVENGNKSTFTISDITSDITATLAYAKTRTVTFNKKVDMAPNVVYNYGKAEPITVLEGRSSTLTATPGEGYAFDYFDMKGTRYGDKAKVIIPNDVETIDAYFHLSDWLGGVFSVSDKTKVRFSRGNLWCDADYGDYDYDFVVKEGRFHFEKNQCDYNMNRRTGFMDNDHVSHFFWCKDANYSVCCYYHGEWNNYDGVLFTNSDETTPNPNFEVDGQKGFWRTLSQTEWKYLLNRKDKDGNLLYRNKVSVECKGLVLLPDDWDWSTAPGGGWKSEYSETTSPKWSEMEAAGAVFLPGAGSRDATSSSAGDVNNHWFYWTSSWKGSDRAYMLNFESDPEVIDWNRCWALSIRVVTEVK